MINEYFVCLQCGKKHSEDRDALRCCDVIQHIWQCSDCGRKFPTLAAAKLHEQGALAARDETSDKEQFDFSLSSRYARINRFR